MGEKNDKLENFYMIDTFFRDAYPGKRSFQTGIEKVLLDLNFDDDLSLMSYVVFKFKYFNSLRVVGVGSTVSPTLVSRFVEVRTNLV